MWEVGSARLAESAVAAASWKLLNGNLSGNFDTPLSHGDAAALRKTKRRVSKSGSAQLAGGEDAQLGSAEQLLTCSRRASAPTNMPAIKKERLDGDDMALTAFNQSEYLAPLNATAIPVVTPHPPPYDHIFAHHRAYLGLHDSALHHQHLHHHTDDLMLERFSSIPDFQPFFDNGEPCIEVECGENKALLYINKLCQGSKGPSIKYRGEWLTPNEFQFVSGRETAKDWKRSIRHKGKKQPSVSSRFVGREGHLTTGTEPLCTRSRFWVQNLGVVVGCWVLEWKGYSSSRCVRRQMRTGAISSTDTPGLWHRVGAAIGR